MLGWYAGNRKQPRLQWVVRAILNSLISEGQRMVTFGSSGGGFAAIYYAAHRNDAIAVPVNPPVDLKRYLPSAVARYGRLAWGLDDNPLEAISAVTDLTRLYSRSRTKVFYLQNKNDHSHMVNHYTPFMECLPEGHDVHSILVDGKIGHHPPDKATIKQTLNAAIEGACVTPPVQRGGGDVDGAVRIDFIVNPWAAVR